MSDPVRVGFNKDEIDVFYQSEGFRTSLNRALEMDEPEGVVTVQLSATLFHELVGHKLAVQSPDKSPLTVTFVGTGGVRLSDGSWLKRSGIQQR